MKTHTLTKNFFLAVLTSLVITLSMTGCSNDNDVNKEKKPPVKTAFNPFDHSQDVPVTPVEKHKFEDAFAAQCLARELKNSVNVDVDKERFSKSCQCVANYMVKDLTDEEAEKFLTEHENPRSLQIKYNSAVYHCTQQSAPKGFKTFETPKSEPKKEEGFFNKFF